MRFTSHVCDELALGHRGAVDPEADAVAFVIHKGLAGAGLARGQAGAAIDGI